MSEKKPFEVGDRVTRPVDVFDPRSPIRRGVIVSRYAQSYSYGGVAGVDHELYAVRWDDNGQESRGYFRHGLEREPLWWRDHREGSPNAAYAKVDAFVRDVDALLPRREDGAA